MVKILLTRKGFHILSGKTSEYLCVYADIVVPERIETGGYLDKGQGRILVRVKICGDGLGATEDIVGRRHRGV